MTGIQAEACESAVSLGSTGLAVPERSAKDRSQFISVLHKCIVETGIDIEGSVLVIGGTQEDVRSLRKCGFSRITLSNIHGIPDGSSDPKALPVIAVDAEDIHLPDNSYDLVFFHEVIHHCRSPHRALCETLRVATHHVLMMEPNDSVLMRLLCRMGFSYPYEIFAVVNNEYVRGGVRNSSIPNFIFRWNAWAVYQLASAFLAENESSIYSDSYWDFNVTEKNLADRKETRIGLITNVIGPATFLRILHGLQRALNKIPGIRGQGNKFFCSIRKSADLHPWLKLDTNETVIFDPCFHRGEPG